MEELDLKELLILFWNKKERIALIVVIFILIGIIYTIGFVTPRYTSKTTLILTTSSNSTQSTGTITTTDITLNSKLVPTYRELIKSNNIIREVISNLGIDIGEEELKKDITVSSVKDTELIEIAVTDENATNACKIANEIAKVFAKEVPGTYNINNIQVWDEAEISENPSNVNHTKDVIIFTFIGLVVAVMYVLVLNMLDTTVKTAEEIEKQFKVPVLASIPVYSLDFDKGGKKK